MIKGVNETIKDEAKQQNGGFLSMVLGILDVSLLGNLSTDKGVKWSKIPRQGVMRANEGRIKTGQDF